MIGVQQNMATTALAASLLEQGRPIHLLSCVSTLASFGGLGITAFGPGILVPALFLAAVLLGAFQTYFAVRVGFDAALFRQVAASRISWADVDHGLAALRLAAPTNAARSEESRRLGALRLLRRQGAIASLQGLFLLAALLAPAWPTFGS